MNKLVIFLAMFVTLVVTGCRGEEVASPEPPSGPKATGFCGTVSEIPVWECGVRLTFYHITGEPEWRINRNWLATTTPCGWSGVRCADGQFPPS